MKAILTYTNIIDGKEVEEIRLFDTKKAEKICDVTNTFGIKMQEIYITKKGTIFLYNVNKEILEMVDQAQIKAWIGENEPDTYIKFFGEVEEG